MKRFVISALLLPLCGPVWAAECGPYEDMRAKLGDKFGEVRQSIALTSRGHMVETYANPKSSTWTVMLTDPSGMSCVAMHGREYQALDPPPPKGDDL